MVVGRSIGFSLWQLQHQVQRRLERSFSELRLTLGQTATLVELRSDPGVSSAELARRLLLTPQALSLAIAKLETAGYLVRTPPSSGRSQALRLTAAGRTVLRKADAVFDAMHAEVFGGLEADERAQLQHWLDQALTTVTELDKTERAHGRFG